MSLSTLPLPSQQTTVDLRKVAYANFFYKNQWGEERRLLPISPTANGVPFNPNELAPYVGGYELETMGDRGRRLGVIDRWVARVVLTLSNGHTLIYNGKRAVKLHNKWRARIYGNKN